MESDQSASCYEASRSRSRRSRPADLATPKRMSSDHLRHRTLIDPTSGDQTSTSLHMPSSDDAGSGLPVLNKLKTRRRPPYVNDMAQGKNAYLLSVLNGLRSNIGGNNMASLLTTTSSDDESSVHPPPVMSSHYEAGRDARYHERRCGKRQRGEPSAHDGVSSECGSVLSASSRTANNYIAQLSNEIAASSNARLTSSSPSSLSSASSLSPPSLPVEASLSRPSESTKAGALSRSVGRASTPAT